MAGGGPAVRGAALALIVWFASADGRAAEIPGSAFVTGGWSGRAEMDEATGDFSGCGISRRFTDGDIVAFSLDRSYRFGLALSNPRWRLNAGRSYDIRITVPGQGMINTVADVIEHDIASAPLTLDEFTINALRRGSEMTVTTPNGRLRYSLAGSFDALNRLFDCVIAYGSPNPDLARTDPFEGSPPPAEGGTDVTFLATGELIARTEALLSAAGVEQFSVLRRFEPQRRIDDPQLVWAADGLVGTSRAMRRSDFARLEILQAALTMVDSGECDGEFFSGTASAEGRVPERRQMFSRCVSDESWTMLYTLVDTGTWLYEFAVHFEEPEDEAAARQLSELILAEAAFLLH